MKAPLLFLTLVLFLQLGCQKSEKSKSDQSLKRLDGLGRQVSIPIKPNRILPLAPSLTEMLYELIPDSCILAVTSHCNYPAEKVAKKQKINVYPLDIESVISLKPEIIFTEDGMIGPENLMQLEKLGIPVYVFKYGSCSQVLSAMDSLCAWLPNKPFSEEKLQNLHGELSELEKELSANSNQKKPTVLALTYSDPIFAYGNDTWMTDKIRLAGGKNVLNSKMDKPYPVLTREAVLNLNPDVIFGGTFEKMDSSFFNLYPELRRITAWQTKQVYSLTDDLASRPSPRLIEGIMEIKSFLKKIEGKREKN